MCYTAGRNVKFMSYEYVPTAYQQPALHTAATCKRIYWIYKQWFKNSLLFFTRNRQINTKY